MSQQANKTTPLSLALKNLGVNTRERINEADSLVPALKMKLKM